MRNTDLKNPKNLVVNADAFERTVFAHNSEGQIEVMHVAATVDEAKAFAAGFDLAKAWDLNTQFLTPSVGFVSLCGVLSGEGFMHVDFGDLFLRKSPGKKPAKLKVHGAKRLA